MGAQSRPFLHLEASRGSGFILGAASGEGTRHARHPHQVAGASFQPLGAAFVTHLPRVLGFNCVDTRRPLASSSRSEPLNVAVFKNRPSVLTHAVCVTPALGTQHQEFYNRRLPPLTAVSECPQTATRGRRGGRAVLTSLLDPALLDDVLVAHGGSSSAPVVPEWWRWWDGG